MSLLSKYSYKNINKYLHIFFKYNLFNRLIHFFLNTFVIKTKIPIISIILFIITITLNSIQYNNHDGYLQSKINNNMYKSPNISTSPNSTNMSTSSEPNSTNISIPPISINFLNIILYFYQIIGIDGFIQVGLSHILYFLFTYICLALIEMNIGYIKLVFFFIILILFINFHHSFSKAICQNDITSDISPLESSYCCGSFLLFPSIGFVLFIIQKHIKGLYLKLILWFIIGCAWGGTVLYDYLNGSTNIYSSTNICHIFLHHAMAFLFGIFCALALSN